VKKDVWDGRTLEWSLPNPPPEYNFRVIPTVHARDAWWYEKHHREEIDKEKAEHAKAEDEHGGIHMPFGSIWPLVTSAGVLIAAIGISALDSNPAPGIHLRLSVTLIGAAVMFIGIYFWSLEGNEGYHLHLDKDGNPIESDHDHH
jgi:cytochrome c oxidase subunit 1